MPSITLQNINAEQTQIRNLLERAIEQDHPDVYPGKRETTRFSASIRLEVLVDLPDGVETLPAILHNISPTGLAMWTRKPIAVRPAIFLRAYYPDGTADWFGADLNHCTPGLKGFLVGVTFHHPLPPDRVPQAKADAGEPEEETNTDTTPQRRRWLLRLPFFS